jgi:type II secretory pathway pseudopilin PulG
MMHCKQGGSLLVMVLLGLLAAGVLATIAYGSYYQIARGTQDTVLRSASSALLTQAAYTLATEASDSDADGIAEPAAGVVSLSDGWEVPASSGAPKTDAWNSAIKYCPWDNGSTNSSSGRLTGANPALQSSIEFALVSAGPDKIFDTGCEQAKTGAMKDDGVRSMSVAQLNQGVGGTFYYGDPVTSVLALPASDSPKGKIRVTLDTQVAYIWDGAWRPLNVGAWLVTSAGGNCTTYRPGTLARDVATDDLLMCQASGIWKRQLNAGAWVVVSAGTTCSAYPPGTLGRDGSDNLFMCAATDGLWRKVSAP